MLRAWPALLLLLSLVSRAADPSAPPAPQPDREILVRLEGGGEAILPTWRPGGRPGAPRLFCLEDLLRLEGLLADLDGRVATIRARGHTLRLMEGARFARLDGETLALALPARRAAEGLLVDAELLRVLLAKGLLAGNLDESGDELTLRTRAAGLERETLEGGELLRLRLPEIPVFESVPGPRALELRLPALPELAQLESPALLKPGSGALLRSLKTRAAGEEWVLELALSPEAELLEVAEVESLGEIQVLLRRRGAARLAEPLAEPPALELETPAPSAEHREELRRIVVDAGHGGHDPGALSPWGRSEKDMTLAIVLALRERLKALLPELEVLLTRDDDSFLPLGERTRIANEARAQLFLSIHANAAKDRRARGHEVYLLRPGMNEYARQVALRENAVLDFEGADSQGRRPESDEILAALAQSAWADQSRDDAVLVSRRLAAVTEKRRRPVQQAGFQVLVGASMPALLVECGFLSNAADHLQLSTREGQREVAGALAEAVRDLHARSLGRTP